MGYIKGPKKLKREFKDYSTRRLKIHRDDIEKELNNFRKRASNSHNSRFKSFLLDRMVEIHFELERRKK